jgi:hypothetical protein
MRALALKLTDVGVLQLLQQHRRQVINDLALDRGMSSSSEHQRPEAAEQ